MKWNFLWICALLSNYSIHLCWFERNFSKLKAIKLWMRIHWEIWLYHLLNAVTWKSILTQLLKNLQKFQNYYSVIVHYCFSSTQSLVFCFSSPGGLAYAHSFSHYFCCGIFLIVTLTPVPPSYMDSLNYIGLMWLIYGCESWTVKKAERRTIHAFELWCWRRLLRVPWTARKSNQSMLKVSTLNIHWKDWHLGWSSNTLATWWEEVTLWKRPWCWERLKAGGEEGGRGWNG